VVHDRDFETLRLVDEGKLIHVNRACMVSAIGDSITLSNGDSICSDAIVFCTGWNIASPLLFSSTLANELGLPVDLTLLPEDESEYWRALDKKALTRMEAEYPMLKNPPRNVHIRKFNKAPFRLFRFIAPPKLAARGDRTILFLGCFSNARSHLSAEIASLWSVAYFENLLPASTNALLADKNEMDEDIAHIEAYRLKRYSNSFLHRLNSSEASEFDDLLMNDLGLRTDRKRMRMASGWRGWFGLKAWMAEWFGNYLASDYEGLVEEFLDSLHKRGSVLETSDEISRRTCRSNQVDSLDMKTK
jgi:dimethylaniline monooxygenase (N-oxide forming)